MLSDPAKIAWIILKKGANGGSLKIDMSMIVLGIEKGNNIHNIKSTPAAVVAIEKLEKRYGARASDSDALLLSDSIHACC